MLLFWFKTMKTPQLYMLDWDYLLQYEFWINLFCHLFYIESHMSLASVTAIGAFQWISLFILTKLVSIIINLKQVEWITCKNLCFCCCCKRVHILSSCCIISFIFNGRRAKAKALFRKTSEMRNWSIPEKI